MIAWIYTLSSIQLLILLNVIVVILAVTGLYLFQLTDLSKKGCQNFINNVDIFMGILSVFLGLIMSFIIIDVWNSYNLALNDTQKEAEAIYLLYGILLQLPNTEKAQNSVKSYLEYIINIEFEGISNGIIPEEGRDYINQLKNEIYGYNPQGSKEDILYNKSIEILNVVIALRTDRINSATASVAPEIWWVLIITTIMLFCLIWAMKCEGIYHYIFTIITGIYIASALFLIVALDYPFTGALSIDAEPFVSALYDINFPEIIVIPDDISTQ